MGFLSSLVNKIKNLGHTKAAALAQAADDAQASDDDQEPKRPRRVVLPQEPETRQIKPVVKPTVPVNTGPLLPGGLDVPPPVRQIPAVVAGSTPAIATPATRPRTVGVSTGLTSPGNLDPYNRTILKNPDGSISTTSSTGVGTERGETIIPTVVDGVRLTPAQALDHFHKTGGNFGSYGTVEQGDAAATALHNDQAAYLAAQGIGTRGLDVRPRLAAQPTAQPVVAPPTRIGLETGEGAPLPAAAQPVVAPPNGGAPATAIAGPWHPPMALPPAGAPVVAPPNGGAPAAVAAQPNPALPPVRHFDPSAVAPTPPPPGAPNFVPPVVNPNGPQYTAGMSDADKARLRLAALQGADYSQEVTATPTGVDVAPPHKMGRLAAMAQAFKRLGPLGIQYGLGGVIGAGLTSLGRGAIDPEGIQKLVHAAKINEAQADVARANALETSNLNVIQEQQQNKQRQFDIDTAPEDRQIKIDQGKQAEYQTSLKNIDDWLQQQATHDPKSEQYKAIGAAIQKEADRISERIGHKVTVIPGNPALNQLPKLAVEGQIVQQQYDGTWKAVFGEPKYDTAAENADNAADYKWQETTSKNESDRAGLNKQAADAKELATNYQEKVTATAAKISALDTQMAGMTKRDTGLGPLQRQRAQLEKEQESNQKGLEDASKAEKKALADAIAIPVIPRPPRRARRGGGQQQQSTGQPSGVSQSKWKADWLSKTQAKHQQRPTTRGKLKQYQKRSDVRFH